MTRLPRALACLIIAALLTGCGAIKVKEPTVFQPHCVPISILSAWTAENKGHDTRIAISNLGPGLDHAQAEALIDGKWTPLTVSWDAKLGIMVTTWGKHFDAEPYKYWDLDSFVADQATHRTKGKDMARLARRTRRRDDNETEGDHDGTTLSMHRRQLRRRPHERADLHDPRASVLCGLRRGCQAG